jgi:hypothetical protein
MKLRLDYVEGTSKVRVTCGSHAAENPTHKDSRDEEVCLDMRVRHEDLGEALKRTLTIFDELQAEVLRILRQMGLASAAPVDPDKGGLVS